MKKVSLLLVLALCLALAACGGNNAQPDTSSNSGSDSETITAAPAASDGQKTLTFALLPKTLSNPYFVAMKNFAEKAAAELSTDECKIEIVSSAPPLEDGVNEQITMFESYLESGVDGVQPCNGDQGTAMGIAENLLTAYPDLQCIYVTSDTGAMGAATAVQNSGRDVKVIGFDGSPSGAESILDGGMTASVAQTPGVMAQEGVKALYELIVNGKAAEDMYTPCAMVTADNANDYLDWH